MLIFYPTINFLEGQSFQKAMEDLKAKYISTLALNYKIWPAANFINFFFLPIQYQVLWANIVSFFFIACLSYLANSKPPAKTVSS